MNAINWSIILTGNDWEMSKNHLEAYLTNRLTRSVIKAYDFTKAFDVY